MTNSQLKFSGLNHPLKLAVFTFNMKEKNVMNTQNSLSRTWKCPCGCLLKQTKRDASCHLRSHTPPWQMTIPPCLEANSDKKKTHMYAPDIQKGKANEVNTPTLHRRPLHLVILQNQLWKWRGKSLLSKDFPSSCVGCCIFKQNGKRI